jgi:hypothetical protein
MGITTMRRMPAPPTATTGRIGSTAACLLEPGHGSTAFVEVTGAVDFMDAAVGDAAALTDVVLKVADADSTGAAASQGAGRDSPDEAALPMAVVSRAARLAVDSKVAVGSTVEVAVDSTVVAAAMVAAMVAATGNLPRFSASQKWNGWQQVLPAVFVLGARFGEPDQVGGSLRREVRM